MSNTFVVSSNLHLTQALYGSTITLHVPSDIPSATVTISGSGYRFVDGTTQKTITGYIKVGPHPLNSNLWNIADIYPYSNDFAELASVSVGSLNVVSAVYMQGHVENKGYISSLGTVYTSNLTIQGSVPLYTSNLQSTVNGLSAIYISSGPYFVASTITGIGNYDYISTGQLQSTVDNLARFPNSYISSASIVSTVFGLGFSPFSYISTKALTSTVDGLAENPYAYISTQSLMSTVDGLSQGYNYVSSASIVSTITSYLSLEEKTIVSTVNNLARDPYSYVSSASLFSTVSGLSNQPYSYVTSALLAVSTSNVSYCNATIPSVSFSTINGQLNTMVAGLASGSNGYMSTGNLTSTTTGLVLNITSNVQTLGYISTTQLFSTVQNLGQLYTSSTSLTSTITGVRSNTTVNMVSTMTGLGGIGYASTGNLVSTTTGLSNVNTSNLVTFVANLGQTYISSSVLAKAMQDAGTTYVTRSALDTVITNLTPLKGSNLQSFVNNVAFSYISTPAIASTINGLAQPPYRYISTRSYTSTVDGLGLIGYISTASLQSTMTGSITTQSNQLNLIFNSSMNGLGSPPFTIISSAQTSAGLISTVSNIQGYTSVVALNENAYVFSQGGSNLGSTSNFYEDSNISVANLPITTTANIYASTFRTIGYGNNYLFGDSTYLNITSDARLKENIETIPSAFALEALTSLRGVSYKKIGEERSYIGCIAQEVEKYFPEVVTTHPSIDPPKLKAMHYDMLTAPMVQAVKELTKRVRLLSEKLRPSTNS
uniref:Peptidase S74 domain-containing protein n=1 Tax=viral metagenome TaxID=1070528 RepID=A0A6C0L5D4_9ZZZZ